MPASFSTLAISVRAALVQPFLCGLPLINNMFQGILILYREFCHITLGLHGLIQLTPFIHFDFRAHKKSGVIRACQVLPEFFAAGFK